MRAHIARGKRKLVFFGQHFHLPAKRVRPACTCSPRAKPAVPVSASQAEVAPFGFRCTGHLIRPVSGFSQSTLPAPQIRGLAGNYHANGGVAVLRFRASRRRRLRSWPLKRERPEFDPPWDHGDFHKLRACTAYMRYDSVRHK